MMDKFASDTQVQDLDKITEEDARFVLLIEGDGYNGQLDAQVAQTILDVQKRIYDLAKLATFGTEADSHRLGFDQRQKLLVQFEVHNGCTEILGDLVPAFQTILIDWGAKMNPADIYSLAKLVAATFIGYISIKNIASILKYYKDKNTQIEQAKLIDEGIQQAHEHDECFAALLNRVQAEGLNCARAAAKTFSRATQITFGKTVFNAQQLNEFRSRSPRSKNQTAIVTKTYTVQKVDVSHRPTIYVDLVEVPSDTPIHAQYSEGNLISNDLFGENDEGTSDNVTNALFLAAATNTSIQLQVAYINNDKKELQKVVILDTVTD